MVVAPQPPAESAVEPKKEDERTPPPPPQNWVAPPMPEFRFNAPREAAESILSEGDESDDEVFSSQAGNRAKIPLLPDLPPDSSAPIELPTSEIPTVELHRPVWSGASAPDAPGPEAPSGGNNPFEFASTGPAAPAAPREPAVPKAPVRPAPLPGAEQTPVEKPPPSPRMQRTPSATAPASRGSRTLVFILAPYAAVVTALAIYGLFFKSDRIDPGHPLSTIPDNFGEFDPASRKKVTQLRFDPDAPLPAQLKAGLGQPIEVGPLAIEPIGVEARKLTLIEESKLASKPRTTESRSEALTLRLRITNNSELAFCPLDPAFNRKSRVDRIGTNIVVGKRVFYGGPVPWPFPTNTRRAYEASQESDGMPLRPGETREYTVCADADPGIRKAVQDSSDVITWRVQLRRGLIEFKGKDVPVTAIIGVEFRKNDVKNLD